MKLWKGATLAILLCCASLCVLLTKPAVMPAAMLPTPAKQRSWVASLMAPPLPPTSSSSPSTTTSLPSPTSTSSSPPRSARMGGLRRRARSVDNVGSLLSEFTYLFQSFTEGELKQIVGALVDRKSRREDGQEQEDDARSGAWSSEDRQSRRTKRARRDQRPCGLREVHRTVSELGLGYESDEMVVFRYCSGKCTARRRHYDMVLEHMQRAGQLDDLNTRGRGRKDKARYSPCCRPTRYEKDMSFLSNNNIFYTIPEVSARECGCV
ncbi:glial cell line-derived neurotrophic factor [Sardina pilchardus]|uniref:glial cell line-derived neurotrophic factor n=1 Tax=Sardina pilchardus TaxID=27697 RepID=UPI002E107176